MRRFSGFVAYNVSLSKLKDGRADPIDLSSTHYLVVSI